MDYRYSYRLAMSLNIGTQKKKRKRKRKISAKKEEEKNHCLSAIIQSINRVNQPTFDWSMVDFFCDLVEIVWSSVHMYLIK